ncbi:MAG: aminoacyl-histidine dipeptidase [Bacteroidales bacterium]|nr:aminoacyl-histidine dipeptidase [Lentimicrobiaceae bacterium]MDD5696129.1 aminoacyl-histidine dipeptidase [Bacteroidales bacterium]
MSTKLSQLKPAPLWSYFDEICQVPRPSKKEEKIREYLLSFGRKHKLETLRDDAGNVLIRKPASPGNENLRTVILQSHMDMVCEKNSDSPHDFLLDPIRPYIDGEWIKAKGTTLGADDGIGMATQLAILASDSIPHGPLECLFTVDEETGLTGAFGMKPGFMNGSLLINLDSEDEGEIFIGCAGGMDTVARFAFKVKKVSGNLVAFRVKAGGLKGGHSGDDIHKGLGNSIKILTRLLWQADRKNGIRIAAIEGGNLRNAIPREATAIIVVPAKKQQEFVDLAASYKQDVKYELGITEPDLYLTVEETELPEKVMGGKLQRKLLNALYGCPHGVIAMSQRMPGMVETSTNLASVKRTEEGYLEVCTSQRSDTTSSKHDIARMVESVFRLAGAKVTHSDGYPGWSPNPDSAILKISVKAYEDLFSKVPVVRSIHAGLECGLFLEKYPGLDMISIGPTLRGVHSPDERLEIASVIKFWDFLLEILRRTPAID